MQCTDKPVLALAGANTTYWNVYASKTLKLPGCAFGPMINFIGTYSSPATTWGRRLSAAAAPAAVVPSGTATTSGGSGTTVAAQSLQTSWCANMQWYVELMDNHAALSPPDLYVAMVAARKAGTLH